MRTTKKINESNCDPYEDMVRLEGLDPYESLLKYKSLSKKEYKPIK